jgi:hypothetical protein
LRRELEGLIAGLDELAGRVSSGIPVLGLTELRLWAQARQSQVSIREVFLKAVQENLAALG